MPWAMVRNLSSQGLAAPAIIRAVLCMRTSALSFSFEDAAMKMRAQQTASRPVAVTGSCAVTWKKALSVSNPVMMAT